jgi:UDPglucose 6-dehydrogenase
MICVIGLGFVGLTTALGFSLKGYRVYGYDIDANRRALLKASKIPFHEPFLEDALKRMTGKSFFLAEDLKEAVDRSETVFFCVGTPNDDTGSVNLAGLYGALNETLRYMGKEDFKVLVIKSTVPPSTTRNKIKPYIERQGFKVGESIGLANNPEFLREGFAWEDFTNPDRIIIGHEDKQSGSIIENLYNNFHAPVFKVSFNTAEFIKYLSNTLLSTLISFSNEMSMIADMVGDIDVKDSFRILHLDKRWGGKSGTMASYAYPGCGFGGYCLPKDTEAIYSEMKMRGYTPELLKSVMSVNKGIKRHVADKISKFVDKSEYIGVLGLSFKPNTDDVRDSPAMAIVRLLMEKGYKRIIAYDPLAANNFKRESELPIEHARTLEELVSKADLLVLLTAWEEFKDKQYLFSTKRILDFRYFL